LSVKPPNSAELARIASEIGFNFDAGDVEFFRGLLEGALKGYEPLDKLPDALPYPRYPRLPGRIPSAEENPFGGFARVVEIPGAPQGPLSGRTIVVKDCICVAGVPLMNGSATFEGYTPEIDATVVSRVLDAGGKIVGKSANEDYCFSGGSHTNARGPVDNPWKAGHTAGGSSSGSAALVGGGVVDMALGTDQGGSVRQPAACSGIVGMKATFGLVPCTGNLGMEYSLDHVGPMTRTVADNALLLGVIAGPDGLDSRQVDLELDDYAADLDKGVEGLKIGLLAEGFGLPQSDARVDRAVSSAAERLESEGAKVGDISVPMQRMAGAIWLPRANEGVFATLFQGNGYGYGPKGVYLDSAMQRQSMWRPQADLLADTVKLGMLAGAYMQQAYAGRYYARSQNLARALTAAYDRALSEVDVLIAPTIPFLAPPHPAPDAGRAAVISTAYGMTTNTSPFNVTGHPSINIPCGWVDGLPVGLMLTGRFFNERLLYRIAAAIERRLAAEGVTDQRAQERSLRG
jgi:amidase